MQWESGKLVWHCARVCYQFNLEWESCDSDTVLIVNSNSVFRFIVQSVSYCHLQQHLYTLSFTIHQLDIDGTHMTVHQRRALPVDILMGSRESWKGNPVQAIMFVLLTLLFIPQVVAQICCSCRINQFHLSKPIACKTDCTKVLHPEL